MGIANLFGEFVYSHCQCCKSNVCFLWFIWTHHPLGLARLIFKRIVVQIPYTQYIKSCRKNPALYFIMWCISSILSWLLVCEVYHLWVKEYFMQHTPEHVYLISSMLSNCLQLRIKCAPQFFTCLSDVVVSLLFRFPSIVPSNAIDSCHLRLSLRPSHECDVYVYIFSIMVYLPQCVLGLVHFVFCSLVFACYKNKTPQNLLASVDFFG